MIVNVRIDGQPRALDVEPRATLLDVLREAGYVGVKRGCGDGSCGTCGVLVDGQIMNACLLLAGQVEGREVVTIHGLGDPLQPHPLQEAFVATGAIQCGFCTPALILAAKALLDERPSPSEEEIAEATDGSLCRCTGYVKILEAIQEGARRMGEMKEAPTP